MSQSKEQQDLLNTQLNVEENLHNSKSNTDELQMVRDNIPGTPFYIVGNNDKGYFLTFAKWRLTDNMKSTEKVLNYVNENYYDVTLKMVLCVTGEIKQLEKTVNDKYREENQRQTNI